MRLSGYIMQEKIEIAKKYLIPRNRKAMGLKANDVDLHNEALTSHHQWLCTRSRCRSLENHIKKIMRKIAVEYCSRRRTKAGKTQKKKDC